MEVEIEKKRKWPKILVWAVIIVFILAAISANVYAMKLKNGETIPADQLKTATVEGRTMKDTLIASGEVVPADISNVYRDPSKGEIAEVYVKKGDKVKKGDELFRYDGTEVEDQLDSLKIKKQQAQMQIDHNNDKISDLEKQIADAEDQHAPDQSIEPLKQQKDEAEFQIEQSRLDLKQVDAQIDGAREKLNSLTVTSEMSGVVESVSDEPSGSGDTVESVVTIVSNKPYEIHGSLSEYDVVHVKKGQAVTVQPKALSGRKWKGTITEVGDAPVEQKSLAQTDSASQNATSYSFTAKLRGKTEELRRGYHVNAEIVIDEHTDVPALPFYAITKNHDKEYAFIVKKGKIHRRQIETGLVNGKWKEVTKGIQVGDKIVLNPSSELKDGMKVVSRDDQAK